jgi:hypothetical protein
MIILVVATHGHLELLTRHHNHLLVFKFIKSIPPHVKTLATYANEV